ncbi:hypothetical protein [EBPR siphovirus 1]|nr:hypothetical protein [EBPR siphovirus 1]
MREHLSDSYVNKVGREKENFLLFPVRALICNHIGNRKPLLSPNFPYTQGHLTVTRCLPSVVHKETNRGNYT